MCLQVLLLQNCYKRGFSRFKPGLSIIDRYIPSPLVSESLPLLLPLPLYLLRDITTLPSTNSLLFSLHSHLLSQRSSNFNTMPYKIDFIPSFNKLLFNISDMKVVYELFSYFNLISNPSSFNLDILFHTAALVIPSLSEIFWPETFSLSESISICIMFYS